MQPSSTGIDRNPKQVTQPTTPSFDRSSTAVILGGGLAGIAAAVRLADRGMKVTLLETRKRLGGRATSFVDPQTGQELDNCQHVLMGCCTNLIDLYKRLGVEDCIRWHRRLFFIDLGAKNDFRWMPDDSPAIDILESDDLPAPMHMTRALMAFKTLRLKDKLAISRGMMAMMRTGREGRADWHHKSFQSWLEEQGQTQSAIDIFWEPVVISALNETPDRVAADYAMHVYQDGFLSSPDAYVMGVANVPLGRLYSTAEQVIKKAGGQVLFGTAAKQFHLENDQVSSIESSDGQQIQGDAYLSALPFDRLAKVCPPALYKLDPRLRRLDRFGTSPILGIHLWFDEPVMDLPHAVFTRSPVQWLFNKGMVPPPVTGHENESASKTCQHLHGVVSAAHDLVELPAQQILDMAVTEVRKAFPAARHVKLTHGRAIKEKRATFSPRPGVDAFRPNASGDVENMFLAGDWTQSGWPATMEGAVRSGYLAAAATLRHFGQSTPSLVPDLPAEMMYRVIGG